MENIYTVDDLLIMLDHLLKEKTRFNWDNFYSNRERDIPFFYNCPDENLVEYFSTNLFHAGMRVLELGCGPGRNAIFFAENGCSVDAVDQSEEGLNWGKERVRETNLPVQFVKENIFELNIEESSYDIIYDSGCFHHIAPHRRMSYLNLIKKALKPNGFFALTCFEVGGKYGGSELTDWDVYRSYSLNGGIGFTEEKLRTIFKDFKEIEIRKMKSMVQNNVMAIDGFMTALFQMKIL